MRLSLERRHALATMACGTAAALILSACAGSDTASQTDESSPTFEFASGTETPGMPGGTAPGTAMPGMPGMSGMPAAVQSPAAAPTTANAVNIDNFAFVPSSLAVPVGTTVTWTNKDEEPHTVASSDGSFHSPGMGAGATFTFTFTKTGSFDYVCSIHPFMHATVVVTP
ncbi:cupredoxin domain-containing protein [Rhodococcus sp. NPDC127528]|uniref:cupredoxin domain-containing protein n=1 Tax=unclassified Rhodococcus (in: high G+C Gram-positive bacteria) TaxID=192944 RepID=UPI0036312668